MTRQKHLVMTALEDYWDDQKPLVFLGDWCCRYSRRSVWDKPENEIMSHPLREPGELERAFNYVKVFYEKVLKELAVKLNDVHGVRHDVRYWRIVVGPWLICYLGAMYDRYSVLKKALQEYPEASAVLVPDKDRETPLDTWLFVNALERDEYNLQIYSALFRAISSVKQEEKSLAGEPVFQEKKIKKLSRLKRFKQVFSIFKESFVARWPGQEKQLFMFCPYLNISPWRLFLKSRFSLRYKSERGQVKTKGKKIDRAKREKELALSIDLKGEDEFAGVIRKLLPLDFPVSFFEGYEQLKEDAFRFFPKKVRAIFSAISWHSMDHFKVWAADMAERGAVLVGNQHGGNYGSEKYFLYETHELNIADMYYSWGWKKTGMRAKVFPMPAAKFVVSSKKNDVKKKSGVLLGTTGQPRYSRRLESMMPFHYLVYLDWQLRFANNLPRSLQMLLAVRLYQHDHGWDLIQRWKEAAPLIKLEGWDAPFIERLSDCRLYVCDHLSTTYLEAIANDKPTILFWDPNVYQLTDEARKDFEELALTGILHFSPESAAKKVEEVYDHVEDWWRDDNRQLVIKRFRDKYARIDDNAEEKWLKALEGVLNK